ncbi:DUF4198 domain-containing protein [Herbaspirillum sp. RTI4]|uniref:DUF4198 domain-containing protein n=1 Tax=Herbaspirillum sp. RTI4 TaxID=3048640 RepID=UPI002AB3BAB7|nr:DUF4198 domain-containing protein [Herbaspirillum sp. RTI4]MDY7576866.1 DUF4198 domain-containing protein [Herbaspirillum sp. RTI4]MEA9982527.1 DUF4198 domain-containing protein [Herbaspirillum sp. RTI4]
MKLIAQCAALMLSVCLPFSAQAHRSWLLPSGTVFSGADMSVVVDAAVSTQLFDFDHFPLRLDGLTVQGPDGTAIQPDNRSSSKYRNSFDVRLAQPGTYKIAVASNDLRARYQLNGQPKNWRGNAATFAKEIPANAEGLVVTELQGRVETFVTAGKPSRQVLATTGAGLEMAAITHPDDLMAGDKASFRLLLDGKPAAGVPVTATLGGERYRDKTISVSAVTGQDGVFSLLWPQAGMYALEAAVKDEKTSFKPASERRASYTVTLEVLPQ